MTASLAPRDPVRRALWVALGVGLIGDAYMVCVRTGWLVRAPAGLLWPAAALAGLVMISACAVQHRPRAGLAASVLLAACVATMLAAIVLNLVPPIARDELTYHLAVPALYIRAGHSVDLPFIVHAYDPMLLEMLYIPLLAHLPDQAPKYLHLACGVASSALVYLYLQRRVTPVLALAAALLLLTTPTILALGASAYVDLGVLLYTTVAVIGLLHWSETSNWSDLMVSALGAGCAASVKYNGIVVVLLLGASVLLLAPRRTRTTPLVAGLVFAAGVLVPLLPWLIKNAVDTGNPVFPLFNGILGGRALPRAPHVDVFTYRQALYSESWLDILLVPLRVFLTGADGNPAQFDGVLNPLWLCGFAALGARGATRREQVLAGFAAVFLGFTLCATVFRSRYVIPVLIPLVILSAEWMHAQLQQRRVLIGACIVAAFVFNGVHGFRLWQRIDPLAYVLGAETRDDYIARFVPEYPVTAFANAHLPSGSSVYLAFLGSRGYYWERPYTYDTYLSGERLCDAVRQADTPAHVVDILRAEGITHIAAAAPLLDEFVHTNLTPDEYGRWQSFASNHLRPLFAQNGVGLYAMVGA